MQPHLTSIRGGSASGASASPFQTSRSVEAFNSSISVVFDDVAVVQFHTLAPHADELGELAGFEGDPDGPGLLDGIDHRRGRRPGFGVGVPMRIVRVCWVGDHIRLQDPLDGDGDNG